VGGVDLFRQTRGPFYRRERAGAEVADGGGPAACNGRCQAWRLWERAGDVRSRCLGTVGVLWRAHAGQKLAESRGKERGFRAVSSLSSMSHGRGLSRGDWGSTARRKGSPQVLLCGLGRTRKPSSTAN
jgi:hypothetical protein